MSAHPAVGEAPCECHAFESRVFEGEGSVRLHALHAGKRGNPVVLLLHGFPDCSFTWRRQIRDLADKGFYVVALDLRGAGRSSTPADADAYHLRHLVADLKAVLQVLRRRSQPVHLVAHDFGAHVAWLTAMDVPVESLAVISGSHPAHARTVGAVPSRMAALGYVGVLQPPGLGEALLTPEVLVEVLRTGIRPGQFTACDAAHYREVFRRPHVRSAMFQWYRQLARAVLGNARLEPKLLKGVRVLTIAGRSDPFLDRGLVAPPPSWVDPPPMNVMSKGGHWPHCDYPELCTATLLAHLRPPSAPRR